MKTITALDLSNVTGGATTANRPAWQNSSSWQPSAPAQPSSWQQQAAGWGAKAGQAVGQWWSGR